MMEEPGYRADRIVRGLGLPRRIGLVVAGLGGFAGATVVGMLWATEPSHLPARTRIAFTVLILIGAAWTAVAAVALARRPLFAVDRVVAGGLAVIAGMSLAGGLMAMALTRASTACLVAACLSLALTVVAAVMLARARAARARLLAQRRDLEAQLAGSEGGEPSRT